MYGFVFVLDVCSCTIVPVAVFTGVGNVLVVALLSSNQPPEIVYEYNEFSLVVLSVMHANELLFGKDFFLHLI